MGRVCVCGERADCPACGPGHAVDGFADDGNLDASAPTCRTCLWNSRIRPALWEQGVRTYWLDDDERNKFRFNGPKCAPTSPIGAACAPFPSVSLFSPFFGGAGRG
eukprot:COSAG01_NODE_32035_length_587_cov_1.200820_2_plen_105_part_01